MDTLHTVIRTIRGETKSRRDHTSVFREFLEHLGRIGRGRGEHPPAPRGNANGHAKNGHCKSGPASGRG